ncbi:MAG: hypothetical protein R3F53_14860 [Gammaproteobacteria bacterium]
MAAVLIPFIQGLVTAPHPLYNLDAEQADVLILLLGLGYYDFRVGIEGNQQVLILFIRKRLLREGNIEVVSINGS